MLYVSYIRLYKGKYIFGALPIPLEAPRKLGDIQNIMTFVENEHPKKCDAVVVLSWKELDD